MSAHQFPGGFSYPAVLTQYTAADGRQPGVSGNLHLNDTESLFNLNGPPSNPTTDNAAVYLLPGLPYDYRLTPTLRLLSANASTGGTAIIFQPSYLLSSAVSTDFQAIRLFNVGDSAYVEWTGTLWAVVSTTGDAAVVIVGQTL